VLGILPALAALIVLVAFRLGRAVFGAAALWLIAGPGWALLAISLWLLLRWTVPIRLGILLGAVMLWGWPWIAGLLLAAPRPFLMVPGYVSTQIARIRHPRPPWHHGPPARA
jgi:hypothetical protein